jgi:hypothetical protein
VTGLAKVEAPPVDLTKAIEGLLAKHGDAPTVLRVLMNENFEYRDKLRDAKAKLPAEGSLTLSGDDAKAWSSYRELGIPKDLRTALAEGLSAKTEATTYRHEKLMGDVAALHGYKPAVFAKLAAGLPFELGTTKDKAGKDTPAYYVLGKGDGDTVTKTLVNTFVDANFTDFATSLQLNGTTNRPAPERGTPSRESPAPRPNPGDTHDERAALMHSGRYSKF